MAAVHDEDEFMLITQQGKILRTVARDIRTIGRATQGVRLIEIDADDRVVSLARLAEREDENGASLAGSTNGTDETN
jgi:DNA gyrase subunit A